MSVVKRVEAGADKSIATRQIGVSSRRFPHLNQTDHRDRAVPVVDNSDQITRDSVQRRIIERLDSWHDSDPSECGTKEDLTVRRILSAYQLIENSRKWKAPAPGAEHCD